MNRHLNVSSLRIDERQKQRTTQFIQWTRMEDSTNEKKYKTMNKHLHTNTFPYINATLTHTWTYTTSDALISFTSVYVYEKSIHKYTFGAHSVFLSLFSLLNSVCVHNSKKKTEKNRRKRKTNYSDGNMKNCFRLQKERILLSVHLFIHVR